MPQGCFVPDASKSSLPFGKIVRCSASPSWPSLGVANLCQKYADLELTKTCFVKGSWADMDTAWLGTLCQAKHKIVFKLPGSQVWYCAGHSWRDTAVLAFPMRTGTMATCNLQYFEFDLPLKEPVFLTVSSIEDTLAMSVTFRSPVWQWSQEASNGPGQARILAFPSAQHGPEPIMRVFCKAGFLELGQGNLADLCQACWCSGLQGQLPV